MKLRIASAVRQSLLFEVPPTYRLDDNAHSRNAYGHLAQEIICGALSLDPIPINGNFDCCFDAEDRRGRKCEIKSVHRSGKVVLYKFRLEKERQYMAESKSVLLYHILAHNMVKGIATGANLMESFFERGLWLCSMDAAGVHALAKKYPLQIPKPGPENNPRHGYNRTGYKDGYYNVPIVDIIWELPNYWQREFVWHRKVRNLVHFQ